MEKLKFKDFRKQVPLNEYIYIQVNHKLEFTTLKKTGRKYDKLFVEEVDTLGNKRRVILHWVREGKVSSVNKRGKRC